MPRRRESLLVLALFCAFMALFGVMFGIITGRLVRPAMPAPTATRPPPTLTPVPPTPVPTPMPGISTTGTDEVQRSLLIIGVDDLSTQEPRLEGCWVVTYRRDFPEYYVLAFPPSALFSLPSLSPQLTLAEIFAEDFRLQRGFQFTRDAIATRFPAFAIEGDVILDRANVVDLVNQVGGLSGPGQALTGEEILAQYDELSAGNATDRMQYEHEIVDMLYTALGQRAWTPATLAAYAQQLPQVSANPAMLSALTGFAASAPPFTGPTPVWRMFEPAMEIVSQH